MQLEQQQKISVWHKKRKIFGATLVSQNICGGKTKQLKFNNERILAIPTNFSKQ